jgi:hypothetical protein
MKLYDVYKLEKAVTNLHLMMGVVLSTLIALVVYFFNHC